MADSLLSTLCTEWTWEPNAWHTVKFKENGTGELYCRVEFTLFIAAEFDWTTPSDLHVEPNFPATIDIDMTLTKRNLDDPNLTKVTVLEDSAFVLKKYRLRLEKGSFLVEGRTTYGCNPVYEYRLLWDVSPFPPLDEWRAKAVAKACRFYEFKDFYQGEIKD